MTIGCSGVNGRGGVEATGALPARFLGWSGVGGGGDATGALLARFLGCSRTGGGGGGGGGDGGDGDGATGARLAAGIGLTRLDARFRVVFLGFSICGIVTG